MRVGCMADLPISVKVLLVSTKHSIFEKPILKAFQDLGHEVQIVDYWGNAVLMPNKFTHRTVSKLPSFVKNPIRNLARWQADLKILTEARAYRPDLIFVLKAKDIHFSVLQKLRRIGKLANYYPETFDHWNRIKSIAPYYDYFFNYDSEIVRRLKETGYQNAYYLPFSAHLETESPSEDMMPFSQRKYSISFIGSFMPVRYAQRETILSRVKDLGLNIWGNKAWLETGLKDYYQGRPSDEEMFEIYRQSKIVINIDLMLGVEGTGVNLRPFEVTSCGALLFNHNDRKDIFNLFEDGREFVSFQGTEDIRGKVEYYLNHEQEIEAVARAGFEKTKNSHTYLKRIQEVLNIVNYS